MPLGFMVFTVVMALSSLAALVAVSRPRWLAVGAALLATSINELPVVFLALVAHATVTAVVADRLLRNPAGWLMCTVAILTLATFLELLRRGWRARRAVSAALSATFGVPVDARGTRAPWLTLLTPFPVKPHRVRRVRNLRYGPFGRRNRLDVYRRRSPPVDAPVLVYLHGGGYFSGGKRREGQAMLHRLADRGWVCISATYRVRPRAQWPDHLIDAKRVLAWVHCHAADLGADSGRLVMAGSSAGAHLTAVAALTAGEPAFQPGFEEDDTSVAAAVCLYGWYGGYYGHAVDERPSSSPLEHDATNAPAFLIVHGDHDGYTPVSGARALYRKLTEESSQPIVYAELPGAQHGFDLFRSLRSDAVIAGVEQFAMRVLDPARQDRHGTRIPTPPASYDGALTTGPQIGRTGGQHD